MRDEPFWAAVGEAWGRAPAVREALAARQPVDLAEVAVIVFRFGRVLAELPPVDAASLLAQWREKGHRLWMSGRVKSLELAYFLAVLGADAYEAARRGEWEGLDDPSQGAFAAMLASYDHIEPPHSPLARESRPQPLHEAGIDTPTPRAMRRPPLADD
jgi:hypothetical protein